MYGFFYLKAAQIIDTTANAAQEIKSVIKEISSMDSSELVTVLAEKAIGLGLKVLAAIVVYLVGAWLIQRIKKFTKRILLRRNVDASISSFILSFLSISLTILLVVVTVQTLGVDTSSFVALLAGSGLAIGMALSGTLQNFSGGIMILLFKPFKVGDYIEALGYGGTVASIQITSTIIKTSDNKTIVLPNGSLSSGTINNYSTSPTRRCDWDISIEYGIDIEYAKKVFLEIIEKNPKVLREPAEPFVALKQLGDSALILTGRAWVNSADYWDVYFNVNESVYTEFPKNGIDFPYPQLDVNIKNGN